MLHPTKHVGAVGSNVKHYRRGLEATTRVCVRFRRNLTRVGSSHHTPRRRREADPFVQCTITGFGRVHGFEPLASAVLADSSGHLHCITSRRPCPALSVHTPL